MRPLIVDLDGTLFRGDLLFETTSAFITQHPHKIFQLPLWLASGKSQLKAKLAEATDIDASSLPYHHDLIAWLRDQKAQGRTLVLATASHRVLADKVAAHLDLFDEVLATEGEHNLKADANSDLLVSRFGAKGFDYVGNDRADFPVWRASDVAHIVSSSAALISQVKAQSNVDQVFAAGKTPFLPTLIKAMRPHQWMKNLLVFVPLLTAQRYGDAYGILSALLAFLVFGLTASSVYLLNDLIDVADDRQHPRKRRRPFASGNLSLLTGWLAWPVFVLVAFTLASFSLPLRFVGVLATYFILTLAYSLNLKKRAMVDVLTLAALYTLRIIAGAAAIAVPLTFWILAFSMFLFLSLALIKRFSELKVARDNGKEGNIRGRGYSSDDLEAVSAMGVASGYLSVLVLALYIQDSHTAMLYRTPQFIWLACPLLLYWISRAWLITHRGLMHDDPIVFALKDSKSWIVAAGFVVVFGLARLVS
jgi:4-hydroxybenzoate polyprenyltransferase